MRAERQGERPAKPELWAGFRIFLNQLCSQVRRGLIKTYPDCQQHPSLDTKYNCLLIISQIQIFSPCQCFSLEIAIACYIVIISWARGIIKSICYRKVMSYVIFYSLRRTSFYLYTCSRLQWIVMLSARVLYFIEVPLLSNLLSLYQHSAILPYFSFSFLTIFSWFLLPTRETLR